jgi:hypothetical protein
MKSPLLYGPYGQPLAAQMYPSLRTRPHLYRPRVQLRRDTKKNISASDRRDLVNTSRQLCSQVGNLGSAVIEKNFWAFGDSWEPHYTGANERWGLEAETFLRDQFLPNCDFYGSRDWNDLLFLMGVAWDRDGDDLMLLTEDQNGSGFPKVALISGARIGNGDNDIETVSGGPFDGSKIVDGIIFDETGRAVAVRVLGEDENKRNTHQDYSIGFGGNGDLAYQPEWADQGRGVPLVARCSLDWCDIQDVDDFLKRGIKRASSVGLKVKNADGQAPQLGNEIITSEDTTDSSGAAAVNHYEEVEGGEVYYLRADKGEEIEGLTYSNPHPNVEAFIQRIERRGLKSIGWSYELIYLGESGRAATRLVCKVGNQSIWRQQKLGMRRTWRAVRYALAKAQKHGFISRNTDKRDAYFSWAFGLPAPLSVDEGNDQAADRENLKLGSTNLAIIAAKSGYHWREIKRQRKAEIITNARDAADIESDTAGKVSFDRAFELLEQRAANPVSQSPPEQPEPEPTKSKE